MRKIPLDDAWSLSIRFFIHHVALHELICAKTYHSLVNKFTQSVQYSHSVVSNSLWTHGQQQAMVPYPSPTPKGCSNSCPLSRWCHPTISSSVVPFSSCLQGLFQWVSTSHQVGKYSSFGFSISPSNEYSGLIFFKINWFDLLAVQGTLKSLLQHNSSKASILQHLDFLVNVKISFGQRSH